MAEHNLQTVAFLTHAVKMPKPGNVFHEGAYHKFITPRSGTWVDGDVKVSQCVKFFWVKMVGRVGIEPTAR